ncbi:MAG: chemotaxis protein CheW [Clostridiaceae bacterium]|nr:chemotaxis protein CheW [Clostridiaceae bacterium]
MAEDVLFAVQPDEVPSAKQIEDTDKYLIFRSGGILFGIHSDSVKEIITETRITLIPVLPEHISGVVNLRGLIVPIVDFRRLLGQVSQDNSCTIVLEYEDVQLGILVDDVDQMVDVDKKGILPVPYQNGQSIQNLVTGMYSLPDQGTLMMLDISFLYHAQ